MGSLTAHLVEPGDHGRLRFHSSCPVCRRERLFGTLSSEPVVSRRAQAVLASGLLAMSSTGPAAALASEPDIQQEGFSAPEHPAGGELDDPGFDPGGETILPFDTAPAPVPPSPEGDDLGEGAPLDAEPLQDPDAQLSPLTEAGPETPGEQTPVPPAEAVPPDAPTAETPGVPASEAPAAGDIPLEGPGRTERPPRDETSGPESKTTRPDRERDRSGDKVEPTGTVPVAPTPYVFTEPEAPTAPATQSIAQADTAAPPQPIEGAFHVVQPGDSLWAIAKRLLGADASPARIAREVNRLWSLNEQRIATGDPDLLMVGTKLRLR